MTISFERCMLSRSVRKGRLVTVATANIALLITISLSLLAPMIEMTETLPDGFRTVRQYGYVFAFILIVSRLLFIRNIKFFQIIPIPLLMVLLWCWFSLTWSSLPGDAFRRLGLTTLITLNVMMAVSQLGVRSSLAMIRFAMLSALLASVILIFEFPDIGRQIGYKAIMWRGMFVDKNIAGIFCSITILLFYFNPEKSHNIVKWGTILLSSGFLLMTKSKTSWIAVTFSLSMGIALLYPPSFFFTWIRNRDGHLVQKAGWFLVILIFLTLLLVTINENILLSLTADESLFSKRGAIWRPMVQTYFESPFTGTGYGSFWESNTKDSGAFGGHDWLQNVDQGHNGYLDLAVQVGLPGLLLALAAFVAWPIRALAGQINKYRPYAVLIMSILSFCIIDNFSESSILMRDTIGNTFLILSLALTARLISRDENQSSRQKRVRKNLST